MADREFADSAQGAGPAEAEGAARRPNSPASPPPSWIEEVLEVVETRLGLDLDIAQQRERLVPWVEERVRALGLESPVAYLRLLTLTPDLEGEWETCIRALTNGQTFFLRDQEHFGMVALRMRALSEARGGAPLQIWSAASSSGEEPYTLALLAHELKLPVEILATDLNPAFLAKARLGIYSAWALRNLGQERRTHYFSQQGERFSVRRSLRSMIHFEQFNLLSAPPPRPARGGRFDLILCRNVFLYFRPERIRKVVLRMARVLSQDGGLIVGSSESLVSLGVPLSIEREGNRVYYRPLQSKASPAQAVGVVGAATRSPARRPGLLAGKPPPSPSALEHRSLDKAPQQAAPEAGAPGEARGGVSLEAVLAAAKQGALEEALLQLEALTEERDLLLCGLLRGHLLLRQGKLDEAIIAYQALESIDPFLAELHLFKGLVYRKAQRWEEAEESLRYALFLVPGLGDAAALLAGTYRRLGRRREAEREIERLKGIRAAGLGAFRYRSPALFRTWFELEGEGP